MAGDFIVQPCLPWLMFSMVLVLVAIYSFALIDLLFIS